MRTKRGIAEFAGRSLVILFVGGLLLLVILWRGGVLTAGGEKTLEIHARMPEEGGWIPGDLTAVAGQPIHLRLVSDDVMHSFAIGQSDQPPIDLEPGKPVETTLTFERPGKYVYYCTRWCGVNHWRMRGAIEVLPNGESAEREAEEPAAPPLYLTLGLDIDAPHPAAVTPQAKPSAMRAESLEAGIPGAAYGSQEYIRSHSPADVWKDLRSEAALAGLDDGQIWDLVASLWQAQTTPALLALGRDLYAGNCAACHGENGAGDGVMAEALAAEGGMEQAAHGEDSHLRQTPADFSDPQAMLGASPAILHGKIVRGGMGTGMPYWGPILTDEQIWAVVDYLWTFQFQMEK